MYYPEFQAGDTFGLTFDHADRPAADGYSVKYVLLGPAKIEITGSVVGGEYRISASAVTTGAYTPGDYWASLVFEKTGEVYTYKIGKTKILPTIASLSTYDGKSEDEKIYEAIQSVIKGIALKGAAKSYTINGRSLERMSLQDLIKAETHYARKIAMAPNADGSRKAKNGIIRARFG